VSANYLPSTDNLTIHNGEVYFRPLTATRARSLGLIDTFTWEPELDTLEVPVNRKGVRSIAKTLIRQVKVNLAMTLKELRSSNLVIAVQGEEAAYTQSAATSVEVTLTDVVPGEMHNIGYLNATAFAATDGSEALVDGTDYSFDAASGTIEFLTAQDEFVYTVSAPAILEAAGKTAISILSKPSGLEGIFTVVGYSATGNRFMFDGIRGVLRPSGALSIVSDGEDLTQIELAGEGVLNTASAQYPWGRIVQLG
jgi:hypothetical protein